MKTNKMTLIGHFAVDSGQAMVGDPCYLDEWETWNSNAQSFDEHNKSAGHYGYLGASNATLTKSYGELGNGKSVVFSTGYGDGYYPVYAELDNGVVSRIIIDFIGDEE